MSGTPAAELAEVLRQIQVLRADVVNVGHGRDPDDVERAATFVDLWTSVGGRVGAVVSWPQRAASWLRPACRLAAGLPDAWVVADEPLGWSGIGGRLTATTWRACRTVAFSGLAHPDLPRLAGSEAVEGMCGSTATGAGWTFVDGVLRVAGDS